MTSELFLPVPPGACPDGDGYGGDERAKADPWVAVEPNKLLAEVPRFANQDADAARLAGAQK
jgi:hypothetical protein